MSRLLRLNAAKQAAQQTRARYLRALHQALLPISVTHDDQHIVQGFRSIPAALVCNMSLAHLHVDMMGCQARVRVHFLTGVAHVCLGCFDVVRDNL